MELLRGDMDIDRQVELSKKIDKTKTEKWRVEDDGSKRTEMSGRGGWGG